MSESYFYVRNSDILSIFHVGILRRSKKLKILVCWKSMLELHFYVGNFDILNNFYVENSDIPTVLAKNHRKYTFSDAKKSSPGVFRKIRILWPQAIFMHLVRGIP